MSAGLILIAPVVLDKSPKGEAFLSCDVALRAQINPPISVPVTESTYGHV